MKLFDEPSVPVDAAGAAFSARRGYYEFSDTQMTPRMALTAAKMDWRVETQDTYRGPNRVAIPTKKALVRQDNDSYLGDVTKAYNIVQNDTVANMLEPLVTGGNFIVDTAGVSSKGRLWLTARTKTEYDVSGKGDTVIPRIMVHWRHDGKTAVNFEMVPRQVVCDNILKTLTKDQRNLFSMTHTSDVVQGQKYVMNLMGKLEHEIPETMALYRTLAKIKIKDPSDYLKQVFVMKARDAYKTDASYEAAELANLALINAVYRRHEAGLGSKNRELGTYWAFFSAVTELIDNELAVSKKKNFSDYSLFGDGAGIRGRAFTVALTAVA